MSDSHFVPNDTEERLALELARRLNDEESLPFFLGITKRYSEPFLRKLLDQTLAVPAERIRKSRGALFNWLLQRHRPTRRNKAVPQP